MFPILVYLYPIVMLYPKVGNYLFLRSSSKLENPWDCEADILSGIIGSEKMT